MVKIMARSVRGQACADLQSHYHASMMTESTESPPAVMFFNAADPSGSAGLAADLASCSAVGCHPLPVTTALWVRDTAEIFDTIEIEADAVVEQARAVLEDVEISAWKVGFLGSVDVVNAVAELLADYSQVPLVTYASNFHVLDESQTDDYIKAMQDLILPQTRVLTGNQSALTQLLLPEWDGEAPPTLDALMQKSQQLGVQYLLVTGIVASEGRVENVLMSPRRVLLRESFELFEAGFTGAGDTLSAVLTAILANGAKLDQAVHEAIEYLDHCLDFGYRPGMGQVVPDRFFWAQPTEEEDDTPSEPGTPTLQ
ncbi:MAG: hydroxymethylpyrimidine/phosphomethylpyrimidine kinase [Betaproteobacteria bacterium]|nr:hydroxymethylpyrimidine/phosphomethylpyrimidine kinase [Betaproteobacteria bacterium]MDE2174451.1 hydroxymethylpyrimidine/phosphomethylpyrimidine kinase [Betaproteobacteria bacterium]MDE2270183.1 hydroxymethylpyrimidine/phosphomethylpyrimidine kinase [Betaproteobacteria bacterium]